MGGQPQVGAAHGSQDERVAQALRRQARGNRRLVVAHDQRPLDGQVVRVGRRVAGARVGQRQPMFRQLSARLFNILRDGITGVHTLRDTQCGLKVFDGAVARAIFTQQVIDGFMFDVETVYIAQRLGLVIYELGVTWDDVPDSRVKLSSALRLLPDLFRIRRTHWRLRPADAPALLRAFATVAQ
mgnify:CR=1 FL=1